MAKTILTVDDSASTHNLASYTQQSGGYEVLYACGGDGMIATVARVI